MRIVNYIILAQVFLAMVCTIVYLLMMIRDKDQNLFLVIGTNTSIPLKYIFGTKFFIWLMIFTNLMPLNLFNMLILCRLV